jgi:hypothetical protein
VTDSRRMPNRNMVSCIAMWPREWSDFLVVNNREKLAWRGSANLEDGYICVAVADRIQGYCFDRHV